MTDGITASAITVRETLELLDGPFAEFSAGVARDHYAFWLGSGISLNRVPGLGTLVPRVIEYLRNRTDVTDANCRYRCALDQALELASLSGEEQARVDISVAFHDWPDYEAITKRLITNYARLLDVDIENEPNDQLLWDGVDVAGTYGDSTLEPDAEHLSLVILVKEGVLSDLPSANWDGLVERAAELLSGNESPITACVRPQDLQQLPTKARLYKFHGCAVKAREDEGTYRPYLIGRASQLASWITRQEFAGMVSHLRNLISTKPTLMIGLSAQDANIQSIFANAETILAWEWPSVQPSFVFSEDKIGADQKGLLKNVYRNQYNEDTRAEIHQSAHLRAYAKQLLIALVLHVLNSKLARLLEINPLVTDDKLKSNLANGLATIRNTLADADTGDHLEFVQNLIQHCARTQSLFQLGELPDDPDSYLPLTSQSVQHIDGDMGIAASGLSEAAAAAGLIGSGIENALWGLSAADLTDDTSGFATITTAASAAKVFFVANETAAQKLRLNGLVDDQDDAILIHSQEIIDVQQRSPRRAPGRTGSTRIREVSMKELLEAAQTPEELMQHFREEVAL